MWLCSGTFLRPRLLYTALRMLRQVSIAVMTPMIYQIYKGSQPSFEIWSSIHQRNSTGVPIVMCSPAA